MAGFVYEAEDSRNDLHFGAQGGGVTLRFHGIGTQDESEIYNICLLGAPAYYLGFVRQDIQVRREGGTKFKIDIPYGTTGAGGGDQPTGSTPTNPTSPATSATPIGGGYSFSTTGATVHLTQSLETISKTGRDAIVPKDFKQAIGVTDKGVEGVDVPAPSMKWTRTVARANVDFAYKRTLKNLTGKVNDAEFYFAPAGTVRYLGAEGHFTSGEGWSITHHFEENENQTLIDICDGLTVPAKGGWEYLWVAYKEELAAGGAVGTNLVPEAAYVEKVSPTGNFALIEIGTSGGS